MAKYEFDMQLKLLQIGDSGVGKTCVLLRYNDDSFSPKFVTTIGIDFKIKHLIMDGKKIKLQIWDTQGQERARSITISYFRGAQGILLIYDVTDRNSFVSIRNWVAQIQMHADPNMNMILVGNKCDVPQDQRTVAVDEGQAMADEYRIPFFEVSAKTGINVDKIYTTIAEMVKNRLINDFDNNLPRISIPFSQPVPAKEHKIPSKPWFRSIDDEAYEKHWKNVEWKNENICHICSSSIWMLFSPYHYCRVCGNNVCSTCSMRRKLLPAFGYRDVPQRICDYCDGKRMAQNMINAKSKYINIKLVPFSPTSANIRTYPTKNESIAIFNEIPTCSVLSDCFHIGETSVIHLGKYEDNNVVIKHYHPWVFEAGQTQLILREVEVLRKLAHPNIIQCLATNIEGVKNFPLCPYSIFPHYPLGSLTKFIEKWREGRQKTLFEWLWVVRLLHQVATAMKYMESNKIFFNYLHTDHIIVVADTASPCRLPSEVPLVKLIDFTNVWYDDANHNFTYPPSTHRAPELWRKGFVTSSTEHFSFGMFVAQVLLSTKEQFMFNFPMDEAEIVLGRALCDGVRPNIADQSVVGQKLKSIAENCWNNDPNDRYNWDRIESALIFIEQSLDSARIVNAENNIRYEFVNLDMVWKPLQCLGPGPMKSRYTVTNATATSTSDRLSSSIAVGFSQVSAAIGYEYATSNIKEQATSCELEIDIPDGKWCQIEQLSVIGKVLKHKKQFGKDVITTKEVDLSPNQLRNVFLDQNPSTSIPTKVSSSKKK